MVKANAKPTAMATMRARRSAVVTARSLVDDLRGAGDAQQLLRLTVAGGGALLPELVAPGLGDVLVETDDEEAETQNDGDRVVETELHDDDRVGKTELHGWPLCALDRRLRLRLSEVGFFHDELRLEQENQDRQQRLRADVADAHPDREQEAHLGVEPDVRGRPERRADDHRDRRERHRLAGGDERLARRVDEVTADADLLDDTTHDVE